MKQSRLHAHHVQLGATFEEITGWEMPAHYGDWRAEHAAVRQAVGVADLAYKGKEAFGKDFRGGESTLVAISSKDKVDTNKVLKLAESLGLSSRIAFLGEGDDETAIDLFAGALADWLWERAKPAQHRQYSIAAASGFIAGEAIVAVIIPILVTLGLLRL